VDRKQGFAHIGVWQCAPGSLAHHGKFARSLEGAIMLCWDLEQSPTTQFLWRMGDNNFTIACYNGRDVPKQPHSTALAFSLQELPGNGTIPRPGSSGEMHIFDAHDKTWVNGEYGETRWEWRRSIRSKV
jgi:hypothetical protein